MPCAHVTDASHADAFPSLRTALLALPPPTPLLSAMARKGVLFVLLSCFAEFAVCGGIDQIRLLGPQAVNLWKLEAARSRSQVQGTLLVQDEQDTGYTHESKSKLAEEFPEQWFEQPVDHFAKVNETETWHQRYWVNTRHYAPGPNTPVFVLDGGETSGEDRLPFLDTGIMDILARATGGIGIVLEHRCVQST